MHQRPVCETGLTILKVRGEAGVCAFTDALKLGRLLTQIRDTKAVGAELEDLMTEMRDDMLRRGAWAIKVSNPVLEDYGRVANYRFGTFGKEAVIMADNNIRVQ